MHSDNLFLDSDHYTSCTYVYSGGVVINEGNEIDFHKHSLVESSRVKRRITIIAKASSIETFACTEKNTHKNELVPSIDCFLTMNEFQVIRCF